MKRNIKVSFQASYESELSDGELKDVLTIAVATAMQTVTKAEPVGLYLIEIEEMKGGIFPKLPPDEKLTTDLQIDRKRSFEKELKEENMWRQQEENSRTY